MAKMVFSFRQYSHANELFGKCDYTVTETIVERDGGLQIDSVSVGVCDGDRVNQRHSKFHPGANLERASTYRLSHGYTLVSKEGC